MYLPVPMLLSDNGDSYAVVSEEIDRLTLTAVDHEASCQEEMDPGCYQ